MSHLCFQRRAVPFLLCGCTLITACLEETTGEQRELDPRIIEQVAPDDATGLSVDGPTVTLSGTLSSALDGPVDVDLTVADPASPGGQRQLGKILLDGPGSFELPAPVGQLAVTLAFFQDLTHDGPSQDDPYAVLKLDIGSADITGQQIDLVAGAYARPSYTEAAAGAPGGGPGHNGAQPKPAAVPATAVPATAVPATAVPVVADAALVLGDVVPEVGVQPFASLDTVQVTLSGTVSSTVDLPVSLSAVLHDAAGNQGVLVLAGPGPFALSVPGDAKLVELTATQDLAGDGVDPADPSARRSVAVGVLDVDGLLFELEADPDQVVRPGSPAAAAPDLVEHLTMPPGGSENPTAGQAGPFDDYDGPTVVLSGRVDADLALRVDLDLRVSDPSVDGGERNLGKVLLAAPGDFAIKVPASLGALRLEGFQDPDGDGPGATDPWGAAVVDVGSADVSGVRMLLVPGARGTGAERVEVPHTEAPVGAGATVSLDDLGLAVDPAGVGPFANFKGKFVKLRGVVQSDDPAPVDIDVWVNDPASTSGMRNQGKIILLRPGSFSLRVPQAAGTMALEAYQDADVDGPTELDPFARLDVEVGTSDVNDLQLTLVQTGSRGAGIGPGASSGGRAPPPAGQARQPFADATGPMVTLSGVIKGAQAQPVFVDLRVPDTSAPGGMRQAGQLQLAKPGSFDLQVPAELGRLEIEAFQDADHNGPDDDDPYARLSLDVRAADVQAVAELVDGGRALVAAAGAPGGSGQGGNGEAGVAAGSGPGALETDAFPDYKGDRVTISGTLKWSGAGPVDVDLLQVDAASPGGRKIAGKLRLAAGPYSFTAPKGYGELELEAFVDVDGDGPSSGDPVGRYAGNPLLVGVDDVDSVDIAITGG